MSISIFDHFDAELVTLVKKDGRRFEKIEALVQSSKVLTENPEIPIEEGDHFERVLPSGVTESFTVTDAGFQRGVMGIISAHYQSTVRKTTAPSRPSGQQHVYNLSGAHSRVNINSSDASTNLSIDASTSTLFQDLRQKIQASSVDAAKMQELIDRVDAMQTCIQTPAYAPLYAKFVGLVADHVTLMTAIAPLLPALAQFI